jgi:hypothetical protein
MARALLKETWKDWVFHTRSYDEDLAGEQPPLAKRMSQSAESLLFSVCII